MINVKDQDKNLILFRICELLSTIYKEIFQNLFIIHEFYQKRDIVQLNWESRKNDQEIEEIVHFLISTDHVWVKKTHYAEDERVKSDN